MGAAILEGVIQLASLGIIGVTVWFVSKLKYNKNPSTDAIIDDINLLKVQLKKIDVNVIHDRVSALENKVGISWFK